MEGIREAFRIKLYREYLQFKESMLLKDRLDLYGCCYRIDVYRNLYEIVSGLAARMPAHMLEAMYGKDGILDWLFESWTKADDSCHKELEEHVEREVLGSGLSGKEGGMDAGDEDCEAAESGGD